MPEIGRNDPCPCGSGKKYKRCCGAAGKVETPTMRSLDRAGPFRKLYGFARSKEFEEELTRGGLAFWGFVLDELDEGQRRQLEGFQQVTIGLQLYLTLDLEVEPGRAIVDLLLERRGWSLSSQERLVLETLARSRLSIYEIREVVRDESLLLRDLWRGGEVWVSERAATHSLRQWQIIVTRVTSWPGDRREMEGDAWVFGPEQGPELLELLRELYEGLRTDEPDLTEEEVLRELATIVNPHWLRRVAFPPPPILENTDGEELVLTELRYSVSDAGLLERKLARLDDVEQDEQGTWIWFVDRDAEERLLLGRLRLLGDQLVAEVNSLEREQRLRDKLAALDAGLDGPTHAIHSDPRERLGSPGGPRPASAGTGGAPALPDDGGRLVREVLEAHYKRWVDEELPALDGLTPREAARDRDYRERLVALLKSLESNEERRSRGTGEPYDFTWIWKELDVEA